MTRPANLLALCAALPVEAGDDVPEWIHLLPAGEIRTVDGRGPYRAASLAELAAVSLQSGQKLVLDECHASDVAWKHSGSAPARGWIVALEARDDGLWGKVEWTPTGKQLMAEKAYAGISPVISHDTNGRVLRLLRASLTNTPNLQGLTALHSEETSMDWKAKLIELLGLDSEADDAAIDAALTAKMTQTSAHSVEQILTHPTVVALQNQVNDLSAQVTAANESRARDAATAFVDAAIAEGRVGLKPVRDDYIALHMTDADKAKKLVEAMPKIGGSVIQGDPPAAVDGALTADDRQVMALFNISEEEYRASQASLGQKKEAL